MVISPYKDRDCPGIVILRLLFDRARIGGDAASSPVRNKTLAMDTYGCMVENHGGSLLSDPPCGSHCTAWEIRRKGVLDYKQMSLLHIYLLILSYLSTFAIDFSSFHAWDVLFLDEMNILSETSQKSPLWHISGLFRNLAIYGGKEVFEPTADIGKNCG